MIMVDSWRDDTYRRQDFDAADPPPVLTLTGSGLVSGYLARWDSVVGTDWDFPRSATDYADFYGERRVMADGEWLPVGLVTDRQPPYAHLGWDQARAHYDEAEPVAVVRCWEDHAGIVVAGVAVTSPAQLRRRGLLPNDDRSGRLYVSGDWRRRGATLELVGIVVMRQTGFPVGAGT